MSDERKPTTAQVRVQPGFFSDKEATALADAIVSALFKDAAKPANPPAVRG